MLMGLIRLLIILAAIFLVRRMVLGIFRGPQDERMRNPHPQRNPGPETPPDEPQVGPQQPIEEADYEDLD